MSGTTTTDHDTFRDAYSGADDISRPSPPALHASMADTPLQTRRVEAHIEVQGSGGAESKVMKTWVPGIGNETLGAFLTGKSCSSDTWLADTGANMHIVNDMKWFQKDTFRPFRDCSIEISTADGSTSLKIKGGGAIQMILTNPEGLSRKVSLSEVAYAPQGKCNLFSGGMFAQKAKLTGIYNDQYMTWMDGSGNKIGHAIFDNGLYHLAGKNAGDPSGNKEVIAATVDFDDPVWKWHRRLGHLGFQNMLKLLHCSTGMDITAAQIRAKLKAICPVCAVTRSLVKIPRDPAKRHAQQPGQMVHVDVWGPYPVAGFDSTKFFLFITDDCTRYTWSARFDRKGQLFEIFKSLVKVIEKAYNITIRCCRLDNEFENGPVGRWCDHRSISRESIEPYAHYQNGVAERTNRTIRERTAPMVQETSISGQVSKIISGRGTELLRSSRIPENLWPEAMQHAVWLKNRTPARALRKKDAKTPYEALKGEKPTLARERIWGSRAYVTYPAEFRSRAGMTKLHSPRGWVGYFVGCESEALYRIYSPEHHKVYRIGSSRVEDGEGLHDVHDSPCLEDRVPAEAILSSDRVESDTNPGSAPESTDDDSEATTDNVQDILPCPRPASSERAAHSHRGENLGATGDDDDDISDRGITSRYFAQTGPPYASVAKKRIKHDAIFGPKDSRQATHGVNTDGRIDSSTDASDTEDDNWYYSDDGSASTEYRNFVAKHGNRLMKNYLPDQEKCDRCFRFGRRCDSANKGMPCTSCTQKREVCQSQTSQTKRLVLPKNRHRKKEISGLRQDPPCKRCFERVLPCYLADGANKTCVRCTKLERACVWEPGESKRQKLLEEQKTARKRASQKRLGFVAVPREQKCYRCENKRIACDGKQPCNKCNTKRLRTTCRPQGLEETPICVHCSTINAHCDRGRPCKRCISRRRTCSYQAQDGLLFRSYTVPDGPIPKGFGSVGPLVEGELSDDECIRCRRTKSNCDGGQPCHRCVGDQVRCQIAQCNYRHSDGTYDSWTVRPFQIGEDGAPSIRKDYEKYTGRKKNPSDEVKNMIEQSRGGHLKDCERSQSELDNDLDIDVDENGHHTPRESAKDRIKRFKFGLAAFKPNSAPSLRLELTCPADAKYFQAKKDELRSHEEKGTWRIVKVPETVKPITSRWVTTDKYGPDGAITKLKARLVARGFQQEEGLDYEETFASVVKPASTRILLALAAILGWSVHQGDVKTAFLNSDLDKPVHMKPPKDIKLPPGHCLLLIRALYGLKQSPRAWYHKLRDTLITWGWRLSAYDPCVFIADKTGLILEVHVDDVNIMGLNVEAIREFKTRLSRTFPMTDEGECSWYLGMHVEQKPGEIRLHQKRYIDQIVDRYGLRQATAAHTPLEKNLKLCKQISTIAHPKRRLEYQSKVGSLNFAANQTRPDISFATGYVARYASNPDQTHMDAVNRIFAYLKNDAKRAITYSKKHGFELKGFVDSDFAGCEDSRRSTSGWVFTLAGGPVSWSSQRQKTVATSTMDAEYIAGAEAAKEAVWIRSFINDLRIPGVHVDAVPLYIDNNSALKLTRNPEFHSRSKHIDVKHHFIREKVEEGVINSRRIDTKDNLADIFTKALSRPLHESVVSQLSLPSGGEIVDYSQKSEHSQEQEDKGQAARDIA